MKNNEMLKYLVGLFNINKREEFDTIKEAVDYIADNFNLGEKYEALFDGGIFVDMAKYRQGRDKFVKNAKLYFESELANMECGDSKQLYDHIYVKSEIIKYLVHNEALTVTDITVFDTLEEANKEAEMLWDHLTYSEKKDKDNRVYVLDVRSSDLLEDAIDEDGNIDWAANSGGGYIDGRFDSDDLEV